MNRKQLGGMWLEGGLVSQAPPLYRHDCPVCSRRYVVGGESRRGLFPLHTSQAPPFCRHDCPVCKGKLAARDLIRDTGFDALLSKDTTSCTHCMCYVNN